MTVNYAKIIASGQHGVFFQLLTLWKGSLYKLVWVDLFIYVGVYYIINFIYRFALPEDQKRTFEEIVKFCDSMKNNIPLSFLLGFFVAGVIGRWWQMYLAIPWMNRIAFLAQGMIIGRKAEKSRKVRLTLMRYMNLAWILLMHRISDQIANRFKLETEDAVPKEEPPKEDDSVRKLLESINCDEQVRLTFKMLVTESEIKAFTAIEETHRRRHGTPYIPEYWVPMQWGVRFVHKAFVHAYISDPRTMTGLIEEIDVLRDQMQILSIYSNILIPLVYTQVVIIAVYSYFLCQLFAAQFVDPDRKIQGHEVDFYIPVFTIFQFLFLMGWLKVAMCVMNPFGDDDEDFKTREMLDYNLDISFRCAGAEGEMYPDLLQPAAVKYTKQKLHAQDNLKEFLAHEDEALEQAKEMKVTRRVSAYMIHESRLKRLRNVFTCRKLRRRNFFRSTRQGGTTDEDNSDKKETSILIERGRGDIELQTSNDPPTDQWASRVETKDIIT